MFIQFMDPYLFWIGAPIVLGLGFALAWYSTKSIEGARKFYGELALLDLFTPRNERATKSLWAQWVALALLILAAAAGPNASDTPTMAEAGSLQVQFVFDVSNSTDAEDYRAHMPVPQGQVAPSPMYQWGTRIDMAKLIAERDFLPQLRHNEVGLITVSGAGYNMWDLTTDHEGALKYILKRFVKARAAPGGGADFTSGLKAAIDSFKIAGGKGKERFIVFFTDGGFTGDRAELDKVLEQLNKEKIHLLIVGLGGSSPVTVPKYDPTTKQRNGAYEGTTAYEAEIPQFMQSKVEGATLLLAPPGTEKLSFDFPAKSGGHYAVPKQANLYPWFLAAAFLLLLNITFGGGGFPKWKLAAQVVLAPYSWLKDKLLRKE